MFPKILFEWVANITIVFFLLSFNFHKKLCKVIQLKNRLYLFGILDRTALFAI